ncbi:alpha/beta fold hydrolase [Myxococcus sp. 1LA]
MMIALRWLSGRLSLLLSLSVLVLGCATSHSQVSSTPMETPAPESACLEAQEADAVFTGHRFQDGTVLPEVRIHYATLGAPRRDASGAVTNAVLRSQPFQDALFAPGRPLDATKYFLIFPDSVGHGRSSKPSDGLRTKFPAYGDQDMVELQHQLVTQTLGIQRLHAIVGLSMGGMNAWQWSELYPDTVKGVMPIVSLGIIAVGVALTNFIHAPWQLLLFWGVLVGLGTGTTAMVLGATVVQRWFITRRGRVMGLLTASTATGQWVFLQSHRRRPRPLVAPASTCPPFIRLRMKAHRRPLPPIRRVI